MYNRSLIDSDHHSVGCRVRHDGHVFHEKTRESRNIKGIEVEKFETTFKQNNLWEIFNEGDPDTAVGLLNLKIVQTLDKLAPKRKRKSPRGSQWMTPELQVFVDKRTRLHTVAKQSGVQDDWSVYKRYRNFVRNKLRHAKEEFTRAYLNADDVSTKWKRILKFSGLEKGKSTSDIKIQTPHGKTNSGKILSNFMNKFFVEKVEKLTAKTTPDLQKALSFTERFRKTRGYSEETSGFFYFRCVDWETIMYHVKDITNTSSTGIDDIGTEVLKKFKNCLTPAILHVVNLCLTKSIYPTVWKVGIVSPIPK